MAVTNNFALVDYVLLLGLLAEAILGLCGASPGRRQAPWRCWRR